MNIQKKKVLATVALKLLKKFDPVEFSHNLNPEFQLVSGQANNNFQFLPEEEIVAPYYISGTLHAMFFSKLLSGNPLLWGLSPLHYAPVEEFKESDRLDILQYGPSMIMTFLVGACRNYFTERPKTKEFTAQLAITSDRSSEFPELTITPDYIKDLPYHLQYILNKKDGLKEITEELELRRNKNLTYVNVGSGTDHTPLTGPVSTEEGIAADLFGLLGSTTSFYVLPSESAKKDRKDIDLTLDYLANGEFITDYKKIRKESTITKRLDTLYSEKVEGNTAYQANIKTALQNLSKNCISDERFSRFTLSMELDRIVFSTVFEILKFMPNQEVLTLQEDLKEFKQLKSKSYPRVIRVTHGIMEEIIPDTIRYSHKSDSTGLGMKVFRPLMYSGKNTKTKDIEIRSYFTKDFVDSYKKPLAMDYITDVFKRFLLPNTSDTDEIDFFPDNEEDILAFIKNVFTELYALFHNSDRLIDYLIKMNQSFLQEILKDKVKHVTIPIDIADPFYPAANTLIPITQQNLPELLEEAIAVSNS